MERLIKDANRVKQANGEMADLSIDSFADVTEAIHIIQTEMGITGTTAEEAEHTITGSIGMMKGAWENLLVGLADGNQDLSELIDNLVDSITIVAQNILPVLEQSLIGIGNLIEELLPIIIQRIPEIINNVLPQILQSGINMINTLLLGIQQNAPALVQGAMNMIVIFIKAIVDMLPQILQTGITLLIELAKGITDTLPELIPIMIDAILLMVNTLLDNIDQIIDAGIELILALIDGLIEALPKLIDKMPEIIDKLVNAISRNLPKIINAGITILRKLIEGIIKSIPNLIAAVPKIIMSLLNALGSYYGKLFQKGAEILSKIKEGILNGISGLWNIGKNIVEGIWNGISGMGGWLYGQVRKFAGNIISNMKSKLGIHSPSTVMRDQVGQWLPKGLAVGIDANTDEALKSIDKMDNEIINRMSNALNMETAKMSFGGTGASVSEILSANSVIKVENYNTLELDGKKVYENQQNIQKNKNLQYGFGGAY